MTLRWPLIGSLVALVAGAGLAALVLAFCGGGEGEPNVASSPTRTAVSRTVTVTRTPKGGTPVTKGTPGRTPSAQTPSAETATPSGGVPAEETPEVIPPPPPEETGMPGPEPTLAPGQTPPLPSPGGPGGTSTPVLPTSTPKPTATPTPTPTPAVLPDLMVLDIFVYSDHLGVVLGNQGHGTVPAGQQIEFRVRGVMAETETLTQALPPGASKSIVFEDQVLYRSETVMVVVDPDNLIPEEDDNNNGLAKALAPDVALDLGVHGVFRSSDTNQLLVVIQNPTAAPAVQVTVVVTVSRVGVTEPITKSTYQLTIEALGFETVEVPGVVPLPGVQMRVLVEMTDPPDANPANNVWEGIITH